MDDLRRLLSTDPWAHELLVLAFLTITLLALHERWAALPGAVAAYGAALWVGSRDHVR
jgi:hypothetical protein